MARDPLPRTGLFVSQFSSDNYPNHVQFRVLREKGTERPGTGEYERNKAGGVYSCAACNTPLYKSDTKFDSGCGWPAFFDGEPISPGHDASAHNKAISAIPGAVSRHEDKSLGMVRIEITCTACGGHLGHIFKGERFKTPSNTPSRFFLLSDLLDSLRS